MGVWILKRPIPIRWTPMVTVFPIARRSKVAARVRSSPSLSKD
jgi:hypothetical protein